MVGVSYEGLFSLILCISLNLIRGKVLKRIKVIDVLQSKALVLLQTKK